MAALVCEICGGKLMGKPGGIFECDSCGMEYSTEWAKAKIQEIKGTVKVEGTVEVQGTVKVEGPVKVEGAASAQSLLRRAEIALEDENYKEAEAYFNQVLDSDPECSAAYFGKELAKVRGDMSALARVCLDGDTVSIRRARQFADAETRDKLNLLDKTIEEEKVRKEKERLRRQENERLRAQREQEEARLREQRELEARLRAEEEEKEHLEQLAKARDRIKKMSKRLCITASTFGDVIAVRDDGKVLAEGNESGLVRKLRKWENIKAVHYCRQTFGLKSDGTVISQGSFLNWGGDNMLCGSWTDIVDISAGIEHTVGLRSDGTVVAVGKNQFGQCDVSEWKNIVAVSAHDYYTLGLCSNGRVLVAGKNEKGACRVEKWTDIVQISAAKEFSVGLRADGKVVSTGGYGSPSYWDEKWTDIIYINTGWENTVGIKLDGTAVIEECYRVKDEVKKFKNLVAIAVASEKVVALDSSGRLHYAGFDQSVEADKYIKKTEGWRLFN